MSLGLNGVVLPSSWQWSQLRHVTSVLRRGSTPSYIDDGPTRVIGQASNQSNRIDWQRTQFHSYDGDPRALKGFLENSDTVVNSTGTGTLGRVGFFTGSPDGRPCIADSHVTVVRPRCDEVIPRFAYYYLSSDPFQHFMMSALVTGATNQIELSADRMGSSPVPLPPMEEQRRIAGFLDSETWRIEQLVEKRARQRSLIGEKAYASLDELMCYRGKFSDTRLHRITDPVRPVQYGIVLPGPDYPGGVPIIKGGDIAGDRLSLDLLKRTDPSIDAQYSRSRVKAGDLVIAIRGSVGEVARVPGDLSGANLTQDSARVAPYGVDSDWLSLVLITPTVQDRVMSMITGATITGINIADLRRVVIPVPSAHEQAALGRRGRQVMDAAREAELALTRSTRLLTEHRSALITAAVTGQIDVTTTRGADV